ncbi:MAG: SPFH domain-containing protein [Erysipelotrichaceae bacterium]|nr:SPFH domain-containing protein [Erysipelotrichaceae bacterium]
MGLIQAAVGAFSSTVADTWKDYFVCDSLNNNVLVQKGVKKGSKGLFGDPDVITNGSGIVVADGQCAIIVDEGQILEVAAEPGMYTFDTTKSPSIFDGGLSGLGATFSEMVGRFTYGGVAAKSQRIYYVNTKEIVGNLYGTPTAIPFRVVDPNIGLDLEASVRCNGEYSFKVVNPLNFFKNVSGNQSDAFTKDNLEGMMRTELLTVMGQAFSAIAAKGVRYSEVPSHTMELADTLNELLSNKWTELRGIKIVSFGINSISLSKEDEDYIKALQRAAVMKDPAMIAANLAAAKADAMRDAANNAAGAGVGFMNLNMANGAAGDEIGQALAAAQANRASAPAANGPTWTCSCGSVNTDAFCPKCGSKKPEAGGFCPKCGAEVAPGAAFCSKCGAKL